MTETDYTGGRKKTPAIRCSLTLGQSNHSFHIFSVMQILRFIYATVVYFTHQSMKVNKIKMGSWLIGGKLVMFMSNVRRAVAVRINRLNKCEDKWDRRSVP